MFTYYLIYLVQNRQFKHDQSCFTQGLQLLDDSLILQSCGGYNHSEIRTYNPFDGKILQRFKFDSNIFVEGLTVADNHIYLLTWRQNKYFQLESKTLKLINQSRLEFSQQGWGLAYDAKRQSFYMSNGSSQILVLNKKFQLQQCFDTFVPNLNQLQIVGDKLYANIFLECIIVQIDLIQRSITNRIQLGDLCKFHDGKFKVLNGIAFNKSNSKLLITGKMWQNMYEINLF